MNAGRTRVLGFAGIALALLSLLPAADARASCTGTARQWTGATNTNWNNTGNWTGANVPDTAAEDAIIVAASRVPKSNFDATVGCFNLQSGQLNASTANTVTVTGDFLNPVAGALNVTSATFQIVMAGTSAQTFQNKDPLNILTISNNSSVTFTDAFTINTTFNLAGSGTTLYVNDDLTLANAAAVFTIPASTTLEVANGAILRGLGGITVNGTLRIKPGSALYIGSGKTLTVASGGQLILEGASGNIATLDGDGNATYNVSVAGSLNASYFRINHLTTAGLNVTGTIQQLTNGEFHYLAVNGYAATLGAGMANLPSLMDNVGFFNDSGVANVHNFNVTGYTGTNATLNNWSGLGGDTLETGDGGNRVNWGSQAAVALTLTNNTATGNPPATVTVPGGPLGPFLFATFAFALTDTASVTDIRSVTISLNGTGTSADVDSVTLFRDNGTTTCAFDASDSAVATFSLAGSPPSAVVAIPAGQVQTSGTTPACIHIRATLKSSAADDAKIAFQIASTNDVTTSPVRAFSLASGPPISGTSTRVVGVSSFWDGVGGAPSTAWNKNANWRPATFPTATRDCRVGLGGSNVILTVNGVCQNADLQSTGTIDFNNTAFEVQAASAMKVAAGHTFLNATAGPGGLAMVGTGNQSLSVAQSFPGNLRIANTGTAPNNVVNVEGDSTIGKDVNVNSGVLRITAGRTLTVGGNLTIASGATLQIDPGGTLAFNSTSSLLTVTGMLKMVGTSSLAAKVTSTSTTNTYAVLINGAVEARYYTFSHLGVVGANSGVKIGPGATINGTNFFQDGSFTFPVSNSFDMMRLFEKIPGNALSNMTFDAAGSTATGVKNVYLDTGIAAPNETVTITTYTGSLAGPTLQDDQSANYSLSWVGATNTLDLTQEAVLNPPTTQVSQGTTYTMGRFGFRQTLGQVGSYLDTDLTSLTLTLVGTATGTDISQARIYFDSGCTGSGGTQIGSGTFSGNPATVTFSIGAGQATIPRSDTSPGAKRCVYVQFDIASNAVNANTVGVKIAGAGDVVNSQSYAISGATAPPIDLGTTATVIGSSTVWTGAAGTSWTAAGSWNGGVPTSALNCTINSATNNPVIAAGTTGTCKSITIGNGTLTLASSTAILDLHGSFTNTGTFVQNGGKVRLVATTGNIQEISTNATIGPVEVTKTGGGTARALGSAVTINGLTMLSGNSEWTVTNGQTLTLSTGATVTSGTFTVQQGGIVAVPNAQTVTVNGGTFKTSGVNDVYDSFTSNNPKVTVSGAGTWNFTATSGALDMTGFILDSISTSGLNLSGTTSITNFKGGRFTNLSTSYASLRAIQLNNTGTMPATFDNIGWNFGPNNAAPSEVTSFNLVHSTTGCNNQSVVFDQWFGDWYYGIRHPDPVARVTVPGSSPTCSVTISASASPVSILSFTARGYDGAVLVKWRTGSELDHAGFNIYRSLRPDGGFAQVNPALIRNFATSGTARGSYRYVDSDVVNGMTYYYSLEDVSTAGDLTRHGSVSAMPDGGKGSVPAPDAGDNSGLSGTGGGAGNAPAAGAIATPGLIDLGNGVHLLARTRHSLRVEIVPPAPVYAPSDWNGSWESVRLAGYSTTADAGKPELAERIVLIETEPGSGPAAVTPNAQTVQEAAPENHHLAPAPAWALDAGTGQLVPSWSPDAAAYADATDEPSAFFTVTGATRELQGRSYVEIKVRPIRYNAVSGNTRRLARLVLDLGLDGAAWAPPPAPGADEARSPALVEGTVRIRYRRSGMYQVAFEDLQAAGVEASLAGADMGDLRLYGNGTEIPLETVGSGAFGPGHAVRFYGSYLKSYEDPDNEVVLSRVSIGDSAGAPIRIAQVDGDPAGLPASDEAGTRAFATAEQDLYPMFVTPLGDDQDHLWWGEIYQYSGLPYPSSPELVMPIELPRLIQSSTEPVKLRITVQGRVAFVANELHHLGVYLNSVPFLAADVSFRDTEPRTFEFAIPAAFFVAGTNTIRVKALGDLIPAGRVDWMFVDKAEAEYRAEPALVNGAAEITNGEPDHALTVGGFAGPPLPLIYDVTDLDHVKALANAVLSTADGGTTYSATFGARRQAEGGLGRRLLALDTSALLAPSALLLGRGTDTPLRSSVRGADLLVVGTDESLQALDELVAARRAQGLRVVTAPLDQVYAEFSGGLVSSRAIRDLVSYARAHWAAPAPKYLLLAGGATYDPRDRLGYGRQAMPIPIERGMYVDFGDDNWFAEADDGTHLPLLAVGRIPGNSAAELRDFARKLLDYESGTRAPSAGQASRLVFAADSDHVAEHFSDKSLALASAAQGARSAFSTTQIDRTLLADDTAVRAQLLGAFADGPLAITLYGHGAPEGWADPSILWNPDSDAFTNARLPIVLGLNCEMAAFYDADPAYRSLGERLVLNPAGGSIAFWGSTAETLPTVQFTLARAFFDELGRETARPYHDVRLGDLALRAKFALGAGVANQDALRSYTLLGDPSMPLPRAAFAPAAPADPPASGPPARDNSGDHGGGFLSCGTVSDTRGGGGGGPGPGAAAEAGVFLLAIWLIRRGRRPQFGYLR